MHFQYMMSCLLKHINAIEMSLCVCYIDFPIGLEGAEAKAQINSTIKEIYLDLY